jgi:DNA-directed RNA polymerase specialized sigma24 family protein
MGIAVHQIHNLVRTYQRALQPASSDTPPEPSNRQADRVSVSAEARELHEHVAALPEHNRDNTKRSR